jgi:hypothetical protein
VNSPDLAESGSVEKVVDDILEEFNPKKLLFIDAKGQWREGPSSVPDYASHEFLFHLWSVDKEILSSFFQKISFLVSDSYLWSCIKKIRHALLKDPSPESRDLTELEVERAVMRFYASNDISEDRIPFLILFEVFVWSLVHEAYRINSQIHVPNWNRETQALSLEYKDRFRRLNDVFKSIPGIEDKDGRSLGFPDYLKGSFTEIFNSIPPLIAEEDMITVSIDRLLSKRNDAEKCEEIFSMIIQKIQPSQGIVTQTSPALLIPCLRLLSDDSIDVSSGVQYHASVTLGILKDIRSTQTLRKALTSYPFHFTKIRENMIYTLGLLKEENAVDTIAKVLEVDDQMTHSLGTGRQTLCSLHGQKQEAILALGKIGVASLQSLPSLLTYTDHASTRLNTCLSWALGEIGSAQREKFGGVSAEIIIALLKLLRTKDRVNFEEAVSTLKRIGLPEFLHTLYLYDIGAVSILGLKPAQKGLYELSETLHELIKTRGRAIIAVNGDSGTGKTYFCQAICNGFGDVKGQEILYLMRDRKKDQKIFDRILGLKWLKRNIDPDLYQDYPLSEEEDDPEDFMDTFLQQNKDRKLILLDGCRDKPYFHRVIELFHARGALDVEVNFRATFSSRRLNLEERECALESIDTHLSFLEDPVLEDTQFYREGTVILYDLDNSTSCRLDRQEIQELFKKSRIERWGSLIQIGDFDKELKARAIRQKEFNFRTDDFFITEKTMPEIFKRSFLAGERRFKMELNDRLSEQPNLLGEIDANDIKPVKLRFYAQDQIAGIGKDDAVFVLSFLDSRIFHTTVHDCRTIELCGRDIYLLNPQGELSRVSFEEREIIHFATIGPPITALTAYDSCNIVTGHGDGSIGIWDLSESKILMVKAHEEPVCSLAVDYSGHVHSASLDHTIKSWDLENKTVRTLESPHETVSLLKRYPNSRILVLGEVMASPSSGARGNSGKQIKIMDFRNNSVQIIPITFEQRISSLNVDFDGRIVLSLDSKKIAKNQTEQLIAILIPGRTRCKLGVLEGQIAETTSSIVMGPKIITCGRSDPGAFCLYVWGNKYYVKHELSNLLLQPH